MIHLPSGSCTIPVNAARLVAKQPAQLWTGAKAPEHPGSWWPDWLAWVKARKPGGGKLKPIEDAPGSYVRVRVEKRRLAEYHDHGHDHGHKRNEVPMSRMIKASEFKAKCLALMDEVERTGQSVVITKNGKPVAELVPHKASRPKLLGLLKDELFITGDIMAPLDVEWDALK